MLTTRSIRREVSRAYAVSDLAILLNSKYERGVRLILLIFHQQHIYKQKMQNVIFVKSTSRPDRHPLLNQREVVSIAIFAG